MVHDAQMDYYGTRLATCSSDRTIKIFEVKEGTQIRLADLRGHEGPVWQVTNEALSVELWETKIDFCFQMT